MRMGISATRESCVNGNEVRRLIPQHGRYDTAAFDELLGQMVVVDVGVPGHRLRLSPARTTHRKSR